MKTNWEYSLDSEVLRLLHVAHQISINFFKLNGFTVLPYPHPTVENLVTFPDLPYLTIPRFWYQVSRLDIASIPFQVSSELVFKVSKLLENTKFPPSNYTQAQKIWSLYQNKIISEIYRLIPHKKGSITNIVIMPTNFGTSCSFNLATKTPGPIYIWLRSDQGVATIVEAILTSLTRSDVYQTLGGMWSESEMIVDWLLTYSPLVSVLNKIDPLGNNSLTIHSTRTKQNAAQIQKSERFLNKIGAPIVSLNTIKSVPKHLFTSREQQLLDLLISHSPSPVTMDEIGNLLFLNHPDTFSLAAIAKSIQRLRDKLELNGISGSFIQTKRGEGYLIID